jgi:hypothetical protein
MRFEFNKAIVSKDTDAAHRRMLKRIATVLH